VCDHKPSLVGRAPLAKYHSRFGRIVGSFALQAKGVPDIVLVLLVELVVIHLAECLTPKYERLFNRQTEDLIIYPLTLV
jgi:hypothetical protein